MGELRRNLVELPRLAKAVREPMQQIIHRVNWVTFHDYQAGLSSWGCRWKALSHDGYDVRHSRQVDYGNVEYSCLLTCFTLIDPVFAVQLEWLCEYWPSLNPLDSAHHTDHGYEMQGDLIEIFMAALRCDALFETCELEHLPELFVKLCKLCQIIQYFDACLVTGYLKFSERRIRDLRFLSDHPFARMWQCHHLRGHCLAALCSLPF